MASAVSVKGGGTIDAAADDEFISIGLFGPPKFFLATFINIVWLDGSGLNVDALYTNWDWFDVAIIAAAESPSSNL